MMSESMFVGMLVLFWLAEFAFGAVVIYWFVRQGFADDGTASGTDFPLEDPRLTKQSLGIWGLFFVALVVGIIVGA
jgi:hypothetical protein